MTSRNQDPGRLAAARAMGERQLQTAVMTALAARGWLAFHAEPAAAVVRGGGIRHRTAMTGNKGFPDVMAVHPETGRVLVAELKAEGKYPEPEQRRWLDAYRVGGAEVHVWRPRDWIAGRIQVVLAADHRPVALVPSGDTTPDQEVSPS